MYTNKTNKNGGIGGSPLSSFLLNADLRGIPVLHTEIISVGGTIILDRDHIERAVVAIRSLSYQLHMSCLLLQGILITPTTYHVR